MDAAVNMRLFIVGCSRSGTTLIQRILAAHPRMHSFPETAFFISTVRGWGRPLVWLGLSTGRERAQFRLILGRIRRPDLDAELPRQWVTFAGAVHDYVRLLDRLTLEAGKDMWCEKSPRHFLHIPTISRYVRGAQFLHVVRDGRDVVASIVQRARDFSQRSSSRAQLDPRYGVTLWNAAISAASRYAGRPGHHHVFYEDLATGPEGAVKRLCDALGMAFDARMLTDEDRAGVILVHHGWVHRALKPPEAMPSRFEVVFDAQERARITAALRLDLYESLRAQRV